MNCEEIEELAGAYALGALPEDERAAVSAHLESCEKHPEMRELEAVAASLALAVPEREPSPALKSRLMDAVRAEVPVQRAPVAQAQRRSFAETVRGWFSSPRLGYGLASAMAVLVVGLVAWNVSLQGGDSNQQVLDVTGNASGRVVYLKDEKLAVMDVSGLGRLPEGKVYEVWAINGTSATRMGTMAVTEDGRGIASLPLEDSGGIEKIGVTVEQSPGVDQPTSTPIFTAHF
jgi:anti-sigma-K factor RskA